MGLKQITLQQKERWWYRIVPLTMAGLAVLQLVFSQTSLLSRWRGGGYGMYSEFHPSSTQIWLIQEQQQIRIDQKQNILWSDVTTWQAQCKTCQKWPDVQCLRHLSEHLPKQLGFVRIEAWRPAFDVSSKHVSWQKVGQYDAR